MPEVEQTTKQIARSLISEELNPKPPVTSPVETPPAKPPVTPPATPPAKPVEKKAEAFDMSTMEIPPEALGEKKEVLPPTKEVLPPEPEPEDIKNSNQKTRHAFAQLRTQLAQVQDELNQAKIVKPQVPATEQTNQVVEQVMKSKKQAEDLQAKLDKAYDEIGKFSLAADPRFKARYEGPQNAILDQVKDIAKQMEIEDGDISAFLNAPTMKQRLELINEKKPDLVPILMPLFSQYDHIERLKQMDLSKHKELRQALDIEQSNNHAIADQTGRAEMFKQAAAKVMQDGNFVLNTIEGNEDWNKNVAALHQKVRYLFEQNDPVKQSEALILGVTAPVYLAMFKKERARRIEVEKQMAKRYGVKPGLDSNLSPEPPRENKDGMSAKEAVAGVLREEMGGQN